MRIVKLCDEEIDLIQRHSVVQDLKTSLIESSIEASHIYNERHVFVAQDDLSTLDIGTSELRALNNELEKMVSASRDVSFQSDNLSEFVACATSLRMYRSHVIDQQWKEHLREMDDLKQSVQNAVYEQKDPLLIYKFEGFELFKRFIAKVNEDTISFLLKADIPVQEPEQVQEARAQRSRARLSEQKEESKSLLSGGGAPQQGQAQQNRPPEKVMPVKSDKLANRNDKVSVQYSDGRVLRDVKYKKVEDDLRNNRCIIID